MDKVQQSIDFLRKLETDDPYSLGFSGGKDRSLSWTLPNVPVSGLRLPMPIRLSIRREQYLLLRQITHRWLFGIRKNHSFSL